MVHVFLFQVGLVLGQARIHQAATFRWVIATLAQRLVRVMTLTAHVVFFLLKRCPPLLGVALFCAFVLVPLVEDQWGACAGALVGLWCVAHLGGAGRSRLGRPAPSRGSAHAALRFDEAAFVASLGPCADADLRARAAQITADLRARRTPEAEIPMQIRQRERLYETLDTRRATRRATGSGGPRKTP
ncbi:MAG: hypothetical protein WAU60_17230 [Candidatus Competibacter denitrificans]|jgi:hypothetical protein